MSGYDLLLEPDFASVGNVAPNATIADLAEETGVYSASPDFVREHCGPIARGILAEVPNSFFERCDELGFYPNIDVRVHRLYPGDFPAVPGWHCDGEYRKDYHSQPDLRRGMDHGHIVCSVSTDPGGVSNTELVTAPHTFRVDESSGVNLWSQVHQEVEALGLPRITLPDGQLTLISGGTLHRATPARVRGWRLFFRLSMWHRPYLSADGGSISRQEHVYRLHEHLGW